MTITSTRHHDRVRRPSSGQSRARGVAVVTVLPVLLASLSLLARASGEERRPEVAVGIPIDAVTRSAIERGLRYLAERQNRNGSWTDRVGRKVHYSYDGQINEHVGVTALAGMAFLAHGNLPDRGPYAAHVRGALRYILDHTLPNGFISAHRSRMYSHAFATLFLAEVYGMTRDPEVRARLKAAIRLIEGAQNVDGGWRYLPEATDADMSITVCQVMALRAARNAGINVSRAKVDLAIEYVKKSFRAREGAFTYQIEDNTPRGLSRATFALTACGVAALYGAGEYDSIEVERGLDYLWNINNRPLASAAPGRFDYYYGHYYAVQAAFQKGGRYWTEWYRLIRAELLGLQEPDGAWRDLVGKNYATAMATIILQMPFQYLPITER